MTPHNEAKKGDIAKIVLMPGDPLRAKLIAETYLENCKLVNTIRNIFAYTGNYKGKEISVMASGMGMPSMGIYCYELYKFYNVETIIRIGSCGAFAENLKMFDLILVDNTYTEGNFALSLANDDCHIISGTDSINLIIEDTAKSNNIPITRGNTICSECFDYYMDDYKKALERAPKNLNLIATEMEAFALFYTAKHLNKNASCILSVVDSHFYHTEATAKEREQALHKMIKLSLDSCTNI